MGSIEYHLAELDIALDKTDNRRVLPDIGDSDQVILDIGCGIGQSFIALGCTDKICVGLDIDEDAIRYGIEHYGSKIQFILSDAKRIPLPSNLFNFVFSRVSLPYTNIPKVIKEIRRVLRSDGRVWMLLHSREMALNYLKESINSRNAKQLVYALYILANGYLFKQFGIVLPFITGRYESWQDTTTMARLLSRAGFDVKINEVGNHTIIEGRLG